MSLALLFAVIITGIGSKLFRRYTHQYCQRGGPGHAAVTRYVYSPVRTFKIIFSAIGLDSIAKIQWLDNDHKFMALLLAYCFGMVAIC